MPSSSLAIKRREALLHSGRKKRIGTSPPLSAGKKKEKGKGMSFEGPALFVLGVGKDKRGGGEDGPPFFERKCPASIEGRKRARREGWRLSNGGREKGRRDFLRRMGKRKKEYRLLPFFPEKRKIRAP